MQTLLASAKLPSLSVIELYMSISWMDLGHVVGTAYFALGAIYQPVDALLA